VISLKFCSGQRLPGGGRTKSAASRPALNTSAIIGTRRVVRHSVEQVTKEWRAAYAPRHQMPRRRGRQALWSCGIGDGNTCCDPHPPAVLSTDGRRNGTCSTRQRGTVDLHAMCCNWMVRFDLLVSFGDSDGGLLHEASSPHPLPVGSEREGASDGECVPTVNGSISRGRRRQRRGPGCSSARGSRPPPTTRAVETPGLWILLWCGSQAAEAKPDGQDPGVRRLVGVNGTTGPAVSERWRKGWVRAGGCRCPSRIEVRELIVTMQEWNQGRVPFESYLCVGCRPTCR
jgi:hypothetical protein